MARFVWWCAAVVAAALTAWVAMSWQLYDVDMRCSKNGDSSLALPCDSSLISALGVWPVALQGILLVGPAAIAAIVDRRKISWIALAILFLLSTTGVAMWTSPIVTLLIAAPVSVVGLIATVIQHVR